MLHNNTLFVLSSLSDDSNRQEFLLNSGLKPDYIFLTNFMYAQYVG